MKSAFTHIPMYEDDETTILHHHSSRKFLETLFTTRFNSMQILKCVDIEKAHSSWIKERVHLIIR